MVKKTEALKILKREGDYEENLMNDLTNFFPASLKEIKELSQTEIFELNKQLSLIRDESETHKKMFKSLIDFVKKDGSNNY